MNRIVILLLILVLNTPASFAAGYRDDNHYKCGTFVSKEELFSKDSINIDHMRDEGLQAYYDSKSGFFRIHYDTTDTDSTDYAVDPTDINGNGVPDYVDSVAMYFDYVYDQEVNLMGYLSPYPDNGKGGSKAYDVYILNIGDDGYLGFTQPENIFGSGKYYRYYSYIVIDNDYSPQDSSLYYKSLVQTYQHESGMDLVKVTAAHEFHHAIQFMYGKTPDNLLHEMSSTFMENRVFPGTRDFIHFMNGLFNAPEKYPFGMGHDFDAGYRYAVFGHYMYENYGDAPLKRMWEMIKDGTRPYQALDDAIAEAGSRLNDAWCNFLEWIYHTGDRAIPGKYFKLATEFPTLKFSYDNDFQPPSRQINGKLYAYEFFPARITFEGESGNTDDTLDIILSNTDKESAVTNNKDKYIDYTIAAVKGNTPGGIRIGSTDYYYLINTLENLSCFYDTIRAGGGTTNLAYAYPNPFRYGIDENLYFPAPESARLGEVVRITIYNASLDEVFSEEKEVSLHNSNKVLNWDEAADKLSSGIYIFKVNNNDKEIIGKFALRK